MVQVARHFACGGVIMEKINVVYCKDCKCLKYQRCIAIDGEFFEVMYCQKLDIQVKDNFYCAFGRHKERLE